MNFIALLIFSALSTFGLTQIHYPVINPASIIFFQEYAGFCLGVFILVVIAVPINVAIEDYHKGFHRSG